MNDVANTGDTTALSANPWRDVSLRTIASVAVPFWGYVALSNILYGLLIVKDMPAEEIGARLLQFAVLTVLVIPCYKLALRIGWPRPRSPRVILAQVALAVLFAASARFILWATFSLVMWDPSWMTADRMELVPELRLIGASFVNQLLAYLAGLAVLLGILTFRRLREVTLRAERAEREYVTARLQALRGQLNPHFLFNTLHSVCGLIDERPGTARTMLVRLGDLLRSSFRDEEQERVPLAEELDTVRTYLEIQKLRFSDRLAFQIDVAAGLEAAPVPRFVLQPLAENAIMHGMADEEDRVEIRINARETHGRLEPFDETRFEVAMKRVRERLTGGITPSLQAMIRDSLSAVLTASFNRGSDGPLKRLAADRDGRVVFVDVDDIECIEARGNYILVHTDSESFLLRSSLQQAEATLDRTKFLRIHRSIIVSTTHIREMERAPGGEYTVTLRNRQKYTASSGFNHNLLEFIRRSRPG